jgi:hypothetical protein
MKMHILGAAALMAAALPVQAATFNAWADFSIAANPNGPWRYGFGTPGVSFTPFTDATPTFNGVVGFPGWFSPSEPFLVPVVLANNTGAVLVTGTATVPADSLLLHPGVTDDLAAIVQFVVPTSAIYDYVFDFANADFGFVDVSVDVNGTSLFSQSALFGSAGAAGFVALSAGDVVSFVVGRAGSFFNDSTAFTATLTSRDPGGEVPVPAPASLTLLLAGIGVLGAARRGAR